MLPIALAGFTRADAGFLPSETARSPSSSEAPGFDFYVLALTWSPGYCASEGPDANRSECARRKGFMVHGLWPELEYGYRENCPMNGPLRVDDASARALLDVMPSIGLIGHEWRAHGTCSGLDQKRYFSTLRRAWSGIRIPRAFETVTPRRDVDPASVEGAFRAANPGLPADGIAVTCKGRYLTGVRICLTKNLDFRACPRVDRQACRRQRVTMPPRGG